jgi:hypothetical protein
MVIINDHHDHTQTIQCNGFGCGKTEEFDEETRLSEINNKLLQIGWTIIVAKKFTRYYCSECFSSLDNYK